MLLIISSKNNKMKNTRQNCLRASTKTSDQSHSGRISLTSNETRHQHFGKFLSCLVLISACLHLVSSEYIDEDTLTKFRCEEALPECECDAYEEVVALICRNVSNFETFSRTLQDRSVFEVNTAFMISLFGARVLPREFLSGLIVGKLMIEDSGMEIVEDGAFDGVLRLQRFKVQLSSLKFIYLDRNNLTVLDSILHSDMHEVEKLQLSYNPLTTITENSFSGKINRIRFLYMDHCLINEFNASHFRDLSRLSSLDLSFNLIEGVTNQSIQFGHAIELDFTGNRIKEFSGDFAKEASGLYLGRNQLTSAGQILQYSEISRVNLAENQIDVLESGDFNRIRGIISLDLQGNRISEVNPYTFRSNRGTLKYLDLSRNQIRSLQGSVRHLTVLILLNLTKNMIESFVEGEFRGMVQLMELHLDGNHITTLGNEIRSLRSLRNLILGNNKIATLKPEQIPQIVKFLNLEGNPIKCDCQLQPFLQYIGSSSVVTDVPICTESNQTSLLPSANCPDGCRCSCMQKDDGDFVSVDCSSTGLIELPRLFTNECSSALKENCASVKIHLSRGTHFPEAGSFVIADDIGYLNLTNNHLQSLEGAHLPDRLSYFYLSKNRFQQPPSSRIFILENLKEVTLSDNPWTCDCESLAFKEWLLLKSDIVTDANETRCGPQTSGFAGRAIGLLTDDDICPGNNEFTTSVTI